MNRFPRDEFTNEMGPDERKVCVAFYMERLVDQAQGVSHEPRIIRRPNFNSQGSCRVVEGIPTKDIFVGQEETDSKL